RQTESKGLRKALAAVEKDIRSGIAFSDAVEKHPKIFPLLFVNMIRAGELTGNLDETLDRLAAYFEKQHSLKKKIQSTLAYPMILSVLLIAVVIFLMVYIVPQFTAIYDSLGGELPAITQLLLCMREVVQAYWWLFTIFVILATIAFIFLYRTYKAFHSG